MTARFTDFDVRLDREASEQARARQLMEARQGAAAFLRQCYGGLDPQDPWYVGRRPVRAAGTGFRTAVASGRPGVLDLDSIDIGTPDGAMDWHPGAVLRSRGFSEPHTVAHMVDIASRVRLNKAYRPNPRFDRLPIAYPQALAADEINDTVTLRDLDEPQGRMRVQRSCYLDQVATNIHCDEAVDGMGGLSFRVSDIGFDGRPAPWRTSVLAHTIGVACLFVDHLNRPIMRYREEQRADRALSVMKVGYHVPSSGALEWQHIADGSGRVDAQSFALGLLRGMAAEIEDECRITPADVDYELAVVEFARELPRAGKPQFFLIAKFDMPREELKQLIVSKRRGPERPMEWHEYDDRIYYNLDRDPGRISANFMNGTTFEGHGALVALGRAHGSLERDEIDFRRASSFFRPR